jgi:mRNA interferase YafQ
MYSLRRTKKFKKSFEKIKKGGLKPKALTEIVKVIDVLQSGKKLLNKYHDHQLIGDLKDYRECHIQSDLLLIYKVEHDELVLVLINIGSHSQVFK